MITHGQLDKEINYLETLKKETNRELKELKKHVGEGTKLRASKHGKGYQYYIRMNASDKLGTYIKQKDHVIAENLAQIEYDEKLLKYINRRLDKMQALDLVSEHNPYKCVMDHMAFPKQSLIKTPFVQTEKAILEWLSQDYKRLEFRENKPEYYTRKGLRVRSKSEKIIADALDLLEIPYLYEKPIQLLDKNVVYPDFTMMNWKEQKECYWEHFGLMDDYEYRDQAFRKIKGYEASGILQGVSLITTFETTRYPLNTKAIEGMVDSFKCVFGVAGDAAMMT